MKARYPLSREMADLGICPRGNSWLRGFHPQVVHRMYQSMLASSSSLQRDGSFVPLEWPNRVHHGVPHSPCAQILLGRCRQLLIMIIGGNALTTRPRPAGCIMSSPTSSKMVSATVEFQNPSMVLGLCMARASACSWEGEQEDACHPPGREYRRCTSNAISMPSPPCHGARQGRIEWCRMCREDFLPRYLRAGPQPQCTNPLSTSILKPGFYNHTGCRGGDWVTTMMSYKRKGTFVLYSVQGSQMLLVRGQEGDLSKVFMHQDITI